LFFKRLNNTFLPYIPQIQHDFVAGNKFEVVEFIGFWEDQHQTAAVVDEGLQGHGPVEHLDLSGAMSKTINKYLLVSAAAT